MTTPTAAPAPELCSIIELRRYKLHPGTRDTLVELFDREFVETQEAVGMAVLGQFRDLDDPDAFVWLRGFRDMAARPAALEAFYGGPVWRAHNAAANATMIDSDDVLLLRPSRPQRWPTGNRLPIGSPHAPRGLVTITVYHVGEGTSESFAADLEAARRTAAKTVCLITERSENNCHALPVREGEEVCVLMDAAPNGPSWEATAALDPLAPLARRLIRRPQTFRLEPTARSLLAPR